MGLSWLVFEMKPWDGQADTGPMSATIAHLAVSESTKCILSKTELFVTNFLWPFNAHELRFNPVVSRVQWYSCSSPTILVNFMYTSHDGTSCDQRRRQHGKSNAARGCYAFLVPVLLLLTQWRPLWLEMAECWQAVWGTIWVSLRWQRRRVIGSAALTEARSPSNHQPKHISDHTHRPAVQLLWWTTHTEGL